MAWIDKMHGTQAEHDQLRTWVKRHRSGWCDRIYPDRLDLNPDEERSIAMFSTSQDKWLVRKCKLPVVLRNIMAQYGKRSKQHQLARAALAGEKKDDRV